MTKSSIAVRPWMRLRDSNRRYMIEQSGSGKMSEPRLRRCRLDCPVGTPRKPSRFNSYSQLAGANDQDGKHKPTRMDLHFQTYKHIRCWSSYSGHKQTLFSLSAWTLNPRPELFSARMPLKHSQIIRREWPRPLQDSREVVYG